MTALEYFELDWLCNKYSFMLKTNQHIPNTKKWEFIRDISMTYFNSEDIENDITESDLRYIHNCIIPGFIKGMTDGEIRTFEFEKREFLGKNSFNHLGSYKDNTKEEIEKEVEAANEYFNSDTYKDIQDSYRSIK